MTKDEALKLALPAIYKLEGYAKNASLEFPYEVDTEIAKKDRVEAEAIITAIRKALAQPVQEPVAWVSEDVCNGQFINGRPRKIWWECSKGVGTAFYTTPPLPVQEPVAWEQFYEHLVERNFCQRCGKRTADLTTIHTCTPPRENT